MYYLYNKLWETGDVRWGKFREKSSFCYLELE